MEICWLSTVYNRRKIECDCQLRIRDPNFDTIARQSIARSLGIEDTDDQSLITGLGKISDDALATVLLNLALAQTSAVLKKCNNVRRFRFDLNPPIPPSRII